MALLPFSCSSQIMPFSSFTILGGADSQIEVSEENRTQVTQDVEKVAVSFFKRINSEYPGFDSENIKAVVSELITAKDETTLEFMRNQTIQQGVWWQRLLQIEAKTPLGEVLQEIQNAQESSGRKILPLQTFLKADFEAKKILNGINLIKKYPGKVKFYDMLAVVEKDHECLFFNLLNSEIQYNPKEVLKEAPFFKRINSEYPGFNCENIKTVVSELINDKTLIEFVRNQTIQEGVWWQKLFQIEAKTPLGEVLQEISQNLYESSGRKILPLQTFQKADFEAMRILNGIDLLKKYPNINIFNELPFVINDNDYMVFDLSKGIDPVAIISKEPTEEITKIVSLDYHCFSATSKLNKTTATYLYYYNIKQPEKVERAAIISRFIEEEKDEI